MYFYYCLLRWLRLRSELDAQAPCAGSPSVRPRVCTLLMLAGFVAAVLGVTLVEKRMLLLGGAMFGLGFAVAIIQAVIEEFR